MKKFFGMFLLSSFIIFTGCSDENSASLPEVVLSSATTEAVTESSTEMTPEEILHTIEAAEGIYVYDNASVLSPEEFTECNNYAEWINEKFMLNTAVVTTNDLNELEPSVYAENCYNDIFEGRGSGIILLINNDTNKDYIYKHGSPSLYISENAEDETFFSATKSIVSDDFKSAILELLSLAQLCPEYVFDNGSIFVNSQIESIEQILSENASLNLCVMTTNNITEQTNSELAMTFYKRHFSENKGSMLFIDAKLNEAVIISDGGLYSGDNLKRINELTALKDYYGAVEEFFNIYGIVQQVTTVTSTAQ